MMKKKRQSAHFKKNKKSKDRIPIPNINNGNANESFNPDPCCLEYKSFILKKVANTENIDDIILKNIIT